MSRSIDYTVQVKLRLSFSEFIHCKNWDPKTLILNQTFTLILYALLPNPDKIALPKLLSRKK
jgi:hypothetical protein